MRLIPVAALFLMLLIGCERYEASEDERLDMNSFTREWTGPYGGVPNFTDLNLNDLKSALIMGMDQTRSEIYEIANQSEKPTFENTILALEETGRLLDRVFSYYGVLSSNLSTPEFRTIQESMAPKISQFYAEINHDNKIFKRIEHLFTNKELLALDKEQERLLTLKYKNLVRNGAALSDSQKRRYQNINIRLSELHTKFSNNVLSEEENYFVIIDSSNLSGLPQSLISAYSQAAEALGYEKKFLIANTRSSVEPFLKFSAERNLRKKVWMNYYNRGDNGDLFDNN
ncbi:MAG: M3 family peptidase, partial [Pseudomonadota bacterium]|nr:M3 family peptidase [Pseudomonadota bacterium]